MFLDTFQLRKLELLHLLDEENRYYSISELAQRIGTASSTVNKTIESLKNDCQRYVIPLKIHIKDSPVRSAHLVHEINTSFHTELKKIYIQESIVFHLFEDIFTHTFLDVKTFSRKYFISSTLIYNRVSKLNQSLAPFDLSIDLSAEFEIIGSESQIRLFYTLFYWEAYGGEIWPFQVEKTFIDHMVEEMESYFSTPFSILQKEFYCYWLAINFLRIRSGYLVQHSFFSKQYIEHVGPLPIEKFIYFSNPNIDSPTLFLNESGFLLLIFYTFDFQNTTLEHFKKNASWTIQENDPRIFEDMISQLNNLFLTLYHVTLEQSEVEHLKFNGIKQVLRYRFFSGDSGSFHQEPISDEKFIEASCFLEFRQQVEDTLPIKHLETHLGKAPDFLFFYHHFLYSITEEMGYLPKINVLLLWSLEKENSFKKLIEACAPCKVCFYSQVPKTETIDLLISNSANFLPDLSIITSVHLMNQRYSQQDITFLEEKLIHTYLTKLRQLMNQTEYSALNPV